MSQSFVDYCQTNSFSKFICDYLNSHVLKDLYGSYPNIKNIQEHAPSILNSYNQEKRMVLVEELYRQHQYLTPSKKTREHLKWLERKNTVTITTGHQLCLMLGPLYTLYKIVSILKLCNILNESSDSIRYVPIFWMASEDHDFEEISFFEYQGIKFKWEKETQGFTGELDLSGLKMVLDLFQSQLGESVNARHLNKIIEKAYQAHQNLSDATRFLLHELFGKYGLIILDANNRNLKKLFIPQMKQELFEGECKRGVDNTIQKVKEIYGSKHKPQVNPRDINLFYKGKNSRHRIIKQKSVFQLVDSDNAWTENEILDELATNPEKFSPNVLTRCLYQQVILPNVTYIGGAAEVAYWLQLIDYFKNQNMVFPKLVLRNSALLITDKQSKKLHQFKLGDSDLFLHRNILINKHIRAISNIDLSLEELKKQLENQFSFLNELVMQTDKSFHGAVQAQKKKQLKGIKKLEKRLLKAQRRKLESHVKRLTLLHEELFPGELLQERKVNFSQFFLLYGFEFIDQLMDSFDPLGKKWTILRLNSLSMAKNHLN
ncbi:MAG: bacillithiol biosynthesis cysteine-adding enzyme BshC [Flavobacteriaceae bacterium]|nr:bacillithiol biosynthesis cysteine-adding enzyme BshC [Flavobacteriaceae bacterium]MCY4267854.1 bacillithiol biosynthesis cysteine-adding enzyme BshC [Flavobacteriaceae bacterium]